MKRILDYLDQHPGPQPLNEIAANSGHSISEAFEALKQMQAAGTVENDSGRWKLPKRQRRTRASANQPARRKPKKRRAPASAKRKRKRG